MNARTEKQARTQWCPMVRSSRHVQSAEGNIPWLNHRACCIGSACMAWRFTEQLIDGPDSYQSEPGPTGYCGLAGAP